MILYDSENKCDYFPNGADRFVLATDSKTPCVKCATNWSWGSIVGLVTSLRAGQAGVRFPVWARQFPAHRVQTGSGGGGHSPPSSSEVKNVRSYSSSSP